MFLVLIITKQLRKVKTRIELRGYSIILFNINTYQLQTFILDAEPRINRCHIFYFAKNFKRLRKITSVCFFLMGIYPVTMLGKRIYVPVG
jgi:hypothetical protein